MYQRQKRYVWVEWERPEDWPEDAPEFDGFRARILANPTGGEVNHELEMFRSVLSNQATMDEYNQAIAERVIDWEYENDGERVPAPGESPDNWEAFYLLEPQLAGWLVNQIRTAHRPKATTRASSNATSTDSATQTVTGPEPEHLATS